MTFHIIRDITVLDGGGGVIYLGGQYTVQFKCGVAYCT